MQRLHGNEGGKTKQIQQLAVFPQRQERSIQYLVRQMILLIREVFPPCTMQPWHIQLVIIIVILYLQCGFNALSLRLVDNVDWSLFFQVFKVFFFNQYPLEYNFNFRPPRGTPLWVRAPGPPRALIFEMSCNRQRSYKFW